MPKDPDQGILPLEVIAIADAFEKWGHLWQHNSVIIHSDNKPAVHGFLNMVLRGDANYALRQILILAAGYDIKISSEWLPTKDNGLADSLSRLDFDAVLEYCPQINIAQLTSPKPGLSYLCQVPPKSLSTNFLQEPILG